MTSRWSRFLKRTKNLCLFVGQSHRDTTWVLNVLLMDVLWLTSDPLLVIATVMPNKSAFPLILVCLGITWMKPSDSLVDEALPSYRPLTPEGVVQALNLLAGRLELRTMFQSLPTEDLRRDLRQLVQIQRAIVHVLRLVEGTASDVLRIFVDREAEWEQMQEDLGEGKVDEVVDAGHGVDDGEHFDYDGNLDS